MGLPEPPEEDPVEAAVLWSAWEGRLAPQNAYRAPVMRLARLGAVEMRANGRVSDPKDLTLVRRPDALELPTEVDQDFMQLLFGWGEDAVEEISLTTPKRRSGGARSYSAWWTGVRSKSSEITRRIQHGDARLESVLAAAIAIGAAGFGVWTAIWGLGGAIGWLLLPVSAASLVVALIKIHAKPGVEDRTRINRVEAFRTYSEGLLRPAERSGARDRDLGALPRVGGRARRRRRGRAAGPRARARRAAPLADRGRARRHRRHHGVADVPRCHAGPGAHLDGEREQRRVDDRGFGSSSSSSGFYGGGFSGVEAAAGRNRRRRRGGTGGGAG